MSAGQLLSLAALGDVQVAVSVALGGARCRMSDVLAFCEGTVVALAAEAHAPVDLLVNGVAIASGDLVELDDGTLAVEISQMRATSGDG